MANEDRQSLFTHLGIIEPSIAYVRASIFRIYSSVPCRVSREDSKAHLCYLYLTQPMDETEAKFKSIAIHSEDGHVGYPHREVFYLRTGHPYGPEALLLPMDSAPGFQNTPAPSNISRKPSSRSQLTASVLERVASEICSYA